MKKPITNILRYYVFFILLMCAGIKANAQSELSLPYLTNVFQNTYINPAVESEHTISSGLPFLSSLNVQVIHNGFVPSSFFWFENGKPFLSPSDLDRQLRNRNMLYANGSFDLFHLKLKVFGWDFWYGTRQNHEVALFYPKSLFSFFLEGNVQYADKPMDLTPMGANASFYREHTFGASTKMGKWVFGGRVSLMHGLTSMYLKPNSLKLNFTGDMFEVDMDSDAILYTSGIPGDSLKKVNFEQFTNFDGASFGSIADVRRFMNENYAANYFTRFRNPGFAISAGASYKFDSRTTFSVAFSDLGFITWSDSTKHFNVVGKGEFKGLDVVADVLAGQEVSADTVINDILGNFSAEEEHSKSYTTWLTTKFYLSASYKLANRTTVAAHLYGVVNRRFYPALTIGISQGLGRMFNLSLTASANQRTFTNFGFGLLLKPGPCQIYLLADNYYAPVVNPLTFTNINLRVGMNLVFGRVKTEQGLPYR